MFLYLCIDLDMDIDIDMVYIYKFIKFCIFVNICNFYCLTIDVK